MNKKHQNIKVIGFDADDTLWVNEIYYRDAEKEFANLLSAYETHNQIEQELYRIEMKNLPLYGYGIKGFVISMIEAALLISNNQASNKTFSRIVEIGKEMLNKPVELIDGVREALDAVARDYRLILVTKGDLLDQETKLEKSNLSKYFHHIEILSEKKPANYKKLLQHLDIAPDEFLMVGNSLKSDVLPLIKIGAHAIHVPFHTTWLHEQVTEDECNQYNYHTVSSLSEVLGVLENENN